MLIVQMCRKINNINVQKQWGFSSEKLKKIKLHCKLKLYQHFKKHFLEIICFYHNIWNIFSWIYCVITPTSHWTNASKNTKRQLSQNRHRKRYKIANIRNSDLKKFVLPQSKNSYDPNRTMYENTIREKTKSWQLLANTTGCCWPPYKQSNMVFIMWNISSNLMWPHNQPQLQYVYF